MWLHESTQKIGGRQGFDTGSISSSWIEYLWVYGDGSPETDFQQEIQLKIPLTYLTGDRNHLPDVTVLFLNVVK